MKVKIDKKQICIGIILFAVLFILYHFSAINLKDDIRLHAEKAIKMWSGEISIEGNFISYLLAGILSFFSSNISHTINAICVLLAGASLFRFFLAQKEISQIGLYENNKNKNYGISVLAALSLLFISSIPIPVLFKEGYLYLGTFVPNVWHNSTTILLFPFAILLFIESFKQLKSYNPKRNYLLIALIFINIFIKPNFFMAFACTYPLIMLHRYKFSKTFWSSLIPIIAGAVFLILEFLAIYIFADTRIETEEKSSIGICFMCLFRANGSYLDLPISMIFSLLFPLVYTIWNYKKLKGNLRYWYAIYLLIPAFLIYLLLVEEGPTKWHGNFYWQIIICVWLCFFEALKSLIKDIKQEGFLRKNKILIAIYSLHLIFGIWYIGRILIIDNYW